MRALLPIAVVAAMAAGCSSTPSPDPSQDLQEQARAAARDFLDRYVDPDGRVVRRDQGGDTVSEGQAYGLLLAEVAGDEEQAERVWTWTQEHLQRPDGLLSFHAGPDGEVLDPQAASDADLLAAWARARAGDLDGARRLADAVLQHEVAPAGDLPLVTAGPWATGEPLVLNPSYWSPAPYAELGRETGQSRWAELAPAAVRALDRLTRGGALLPPDWAAGTDAALRPTGPPSDPGAAPAYSLDAQRTVVWLATSCAQEARDLAASWRPLLSGERAGAIRLTTDGTVQEPAVHPLPYVAAAAAAAADGDVADRDRLLDLAGETAERFPTYYGSAWHALGRALLQTDLLDPCEEAS